MNHFEEILRQGQSVINQNYHENQQLYDKSTNQSNLMSTSIDHLHSPFDTSPKASMFFFSHNSPRHNTDHFHFNQHHSHFRNIYKDHIQPITRRLEFQEDQSLFCEQEELEEQEHSVKQEQQWQFESSQTPAKSKKIKKTKSSKGLKNLSIGVYEIVAQKFQTTYKEVANSLIEKLNKCQKDVCKSQQGYESYRKLQKDEHNVKRRVYDALNVLISADLLRKEGKRVICNYSLQKQSTQRAYLQNQCKISSELLSRKQKLLQQKKQQLQHLKRKSLKIQKLINRNMKLGPRPSIKTISLPFVVAQSNIQDIHTISVGKKDVEINYKGNIMIMGDVDTIEEIILQ